MTAGNLSATLGKVGMGLGSVGAASAASSAILDNKPDDREPLYSILQKMMGLGITMGAGPAVASLGNVQQLNLELPNLAPTQGMSIGKAG